MDLSELYHKVILQHNESPFHYAKMETASHLVEAYNPLCGDRFKLYLDVEDNRVKQAHFHGYGCAISKASTSILLQKIEGKTLQEIPDIIQQFYAYVHPDKDPSGVTHDPDFEAFAAAKKFPARLKCATLSWNELETDLKKWS